MASGEDFRLREGRQTASRRRGLQHMGAEDVYIYIYTTTATRLTVKKIHLNRMALQTKYPHKMENFLYRKPSIVELTSLLFSNYRFEMFL